MKIDCFIIFIIIFEMSIRVTRATRVENGTSRIAFIRMRKARLSMHIAAIRLVQLTTRVTRIDISKKLYMNNLNRGVYFEDRLAVNRYCYVN